MEAHLEERVTTTYGSSSDIVINKTHRLNSLQKMLNSLRKWHQGGQKDLNETLGQLDQSDLCWLNDKRHLFGYDVLDEIYLRKELKVLQNFLRRVGRDDGLVIGPLSNGRIVKENEKTITIIYPLREFIRP
jgi:hypothetical protein